MKKRASKGKNGSYKPNSKSGRSKSDKSYFGDYPRKYFTLGYRA